MKRPSALCSSLNALSAAILVVTILAIGASSQSQGASPAPASPKSALSGLYLKALLPDEVKITKLKPGESVEATLTHDVYSADHKLFSSGSHVRLAVDHLERRKRTTNDHWPWVVKAFTPRHENYPVFESATVFTDSGETTLPVSVISMSRLREVYAPQKANHFNPPAAQPVAKADSTSKKHLGTTIILEGLSDPDSQLAANTNTPAADAKKIGALPPGTRCRIVLLNSISASKSKPGDAISARLIEPVLFDSQVVLPAGSLFEGKVLTKKPPRTLSRAGSLNFSFTSITLPQGNRVPISAVLSGAVLDQSSHTRIDREGVLHGERPGAAWMAINLGTTAGIAKVVDDGTQLVIEAIVATATDVSTAGTARIVSTCVSGLFMASRHGRDVVLPRFSEMEITLDRGVSVSSAATVASAK